MPKASESADCTLPSESQLAWSRQFHKQLQRLKDAVFGEYYKDKKGDYTCPVSDKLRRDTYRFLSLERVDPDWHVHMFNIRTNEHRVFLFDEFSERFARFHKSRFYV